MERQNEETPVLVHMCNSFMTVRSLTDQQLARCRELGVRLCLHAMIGLTIVAPDEAIRFIM